MNIKAATVQYPKTSTLRPCTQEQTEQYYANARAFIASTGFYSDMRWDASMAVAEYMASQDGFTLRDWNKT